METINGNLYDFPGYYDLVFGSDWHAEYKFLRACFERYGPSRVQRVLEPACGTGRLLVRLAQEGFDVAGLDLNPRAVEYCNARLQRRGFPPTARVADMSEFREPRRFDAAFNMINSFRHLPSEHSAQSHLECVARALRQGGIYILGLHLWPQSGPPSEEESWSARRGHLQINSRLWTVARDARRRVERCAMTFDIYTPTRQFRLADQLEFRTYTARQFARLLSRVPALQVAAVFDFAYDIQRPLAVEPHTEDVVYVLRKDGR